jgi:hypothetical protein
LLGLGLTACVKAFPADVIVIVHPVALTAAPIIPRQSRHHLIFKVAARGVLLRIHALKVLPTESVSEK